MDSREEIAGGGGAKLSLAHSFAGKHSGGHHLNGIFILVTNLYPLVGVVVLYLRASPKSEILIWFLAWRRTFRPGCVVIFKTILAFQEVTLRCTHQPIVARTKRVSTKSVSKYGWKGRWPWLALATDLSQVNDGAVLCSVPTSTMTHHYDSSL